MERIYRGKEWCKLHRKCKVQTFISWQSYEGLQITVLSFKEICKFLLEHGVPYILSERFSQDDVENYFGRQRSIVRWCDNPAVWDFGYNDDTIKLQYSVRPIAGNYYRALNEKGAINNGSFYSIYYF